jgi:hypothetical protein
MPTVICPAGFIKLRCHSVFIHGHSVVIQWSFMVIRWLFMVIHGHSVVIQWSFGGFGILLFILLFTYGIDVVI